MYKKRYISSPEVAKIENEANNKDDKLLGLYKLLKSKHLDVESRLADPSTSLLGQLAFASIKKYVELFDREQADRVEPAGEFLFSVSIWIRFLLQKAKRSKKTTWKY